MNELLDAIKERVLGSFRAEKNEHSCPKKIDDYLLALGVLLWVVADADSNFQPEEAKEIERVLKSTGNISEQDMPVVMMAVKQAAIMRVDLYQFTKDVKAALDRPCRIGVIENLFRMAYIDKNLDEREVSRIRNISGLIGIDHDEFILAKEKIRKEMIDGKNRD
jgi:uncharacterized tellurite resistance protein B-like protein